MATNAARARLGKSFIRGLNNLQKSENFFQKFDEFEKLYPITEKDIEAYKEYKKGCQLEIEEKFTEAIKHYSRAEKLSDLVGQVYL